jgi:deoxyribodipyrimidine photolyase
LTNKDIVNQKDTVLSENDVLITKQDEVCEIFNNFLIMWLKILETIKDWHPKPERKAARNGLKIFSK